jgi:hypothetical protein
LFIIIMMQQQHRRHGLFAFGSFASSSMSLRSTAVFLMMMMFMAATQLAIAQQQQQQQSNNGSLWQQLTSLSQNSSTQGGGGGMSANWFFQALQNQSDLVSQLNDTSSNVFYALFVPSDNAVNRYGLNPQQDTTDRIVSIPVPSSSGGGGGRRGGILQGSQNNASSNASVVVPMRDILHYHIGNLSAFYNATSRFLFSASSANASGGGGNSSSSQGGSANSSFIPPTAAGGNISSNTSSTTWTFLPTEPALYVVPSLLNDTSSSGAGASGGNTSAISLVSSSSNSSANATMLSINQTAEQSGRIQMQIRGNPLFSPIVLSQDRLSQNRTASNGILFVIDDLLIPPSNLTYTSNLFQNTSSSASGGSSSTGNATAIPQLNQFFSLLNSTRLWTYLQSQNSSAITIFALNDTALSAYNLTSSSNQTSSSNASSTPFDLGNMTDLEQQLANQIVPNSTFYLPELLNFAASSSNQTASSGGGGGNTSTTNSIQMKTLLNQTISATLLPLSSPSSNSTSGGGGGGATQSNASASAWNPLSSLRLNNSVNVIQGDVLLQNGVIHVVDAFFNQSMTPSANSTQGVRSRMPNILGMLWPKSL